MDDGKDDEPRIQVGPRSVPLSEWEGEMLVQAAACVLLIRALELAAFALWGAPAPRVFRASGEVGPLSPQTSVASVPRSVRGWVACGVVSLAAFSLPCSLW